MAKVFMVMLEHGNTVTLCGKFSEKFEVCKPRSVQPEVYAYLSQHKGYRKKFRFWAQDPSEKQGWSTWQKYGARPASGTYNDLAQTVEDALKVMERERAAATKGTPARTGEIPGLDEATKAIAEKKKAAMTTAQASIPVNLSSGLSDEEEEALAALADAEQESEEPVAEQESEEESESNDDLAPSAPKAGRRAKK